ncbi:hypothetical protein [Mycolicibacterium sp. HK-90]|uniref:hypothetical protein n=1 Tax=Mycolicibacterium sp. HK-90 TaxID=3056937 RepID=UPI00265B6934|nr:hypothetical protein [Mycolicibacterium sp. HK-90]WKG04186.1 hypothetical protein QU592_03445 [Mycolicibacterium sp. HK-90]
MKTKAPSKRRALSGPVKSPAAAKPSDVRDGIRQGAKDFRKSVRESVKKLSGGTKPSRAAASDADGPGDSDKD